MIRRSSRRSSVAVRRTVLGLILGIPLIGPPVLAQETAPAEADTVEVEEMVEETVVEEPVIEQPLFSLVNATALEEGNASPFGLVTECCVIAGAAKVHDCSNVGTAVLAAKCGSVGEIVAC